MFRVPSTSKSAFSNSKHPDWSGKGQRFEPLGIIREHQNTHLYVANMDLDVDYPDLDNKNVDFELECLDLEGQSLDFDVEDTDIELKKSASGDSGVWGL